MESTLLEESRLPEPSRTRMVLSGGEGPRKAAPREEARGPQEGGGRPYGGRLWAQRPTPVPHPAGGHLQGYGAF